MKKQKGETLTKEDLLAARECLRKNSRDEPIYIKISIWQAIKFILKGFKVRLIRGVK